MTNIAPTGRTITKVLSKDTIRKGGVEIVILPTLNVKLSNEHESMNVEFCGYPSLVNYNKERERQAQKNRWNRKMRSLRRNIKQKGLRQSGLTHNISLSGGAGEDSK